MFQNQGVNKVILAGYIHGRAEWKQIGKERCLYFQLVTTETLNKNNIAQEYAEYHYLRVPESVARAVPDELEEGLVLYIEGKLTTRGSIDEDGIKRYDTCVVVSKFYPMVQTPKNSVAT